MAGEDQVSVLSWKGVGDCTGVECLPDLEMDEVGCNPTALHASAQGWIRQRRSMNK